MTQISVTFDLSPKAALMAGQFAKLDFLSTMTGATTGGRRRSA